MRVKTKKGRREAGTPVSNENKSQHSSCAGDLESNQTELDHAINER